MGKFDGILIACDLDGTLLWEGQASDENRAAIEYFTENGGLFTVATGRAPDFIEKLNVPVNAPMIAINGNLIYDSITKSVIENYTFPASTVSVVQELVSRVKLQSVHIHSMTSYPFPQPKPADFEGFDKPINKIVFVFDTEAEALSAKAELTEKHSPDFVFERSWPTGLEMRSSAGGKGVCLKKLKSLTGAKCTVAVGDYENDMSMLKAADISYAPSNGHPDVLKAVDRVTVHCRDHVIAAIVNEMSQKGFDF